MEDEIDIKDLKESVDLVEVVGRYVELDENDKCLCPFHNESTPSFNVSQDSQFYHCFGCGANGDVVEFVKTIENVGFREACDKIAKGNYSEYTQEKKDLAKKDSKKAPPLSKEEVLTHIDNIGYATTDYRGIDAKYSKFYGHLTEVDSKGVVKSRHYPETKDGSVTGYKIRYHPKSWNKIGSTGISNDLSGQVKFKSGDKYLLIVGGEEDKVAAYQMLAESLGERGQDGFSKIAVVSPTTGESSAYRQIAEQYEFCDMFEDIIIGMDNDEAGREATKKIIEVLPKDKVRVATWSNKDPNKMLQLKMSKQFVRDFYSAKPAIESGIIGSSALDDLLEEELLIEKIPLPPFMSKLQDMMAGGIPLGYIVNISAETGIGKTSYVNEMLYYWIFNSPHKMGVVSLELTAGQYGLAILSRHIGKKLTLYEDGKEAVEFINTPEIKKKRKELWQDKLGVDRWNLLDERDGTIEELQKQCERLIKKYECKFIVLDPLQDILDGCTIEEQSVFMRWQKKVVKSGITFININHVRKIGSVAKDKKGRNIIRDLAEDDIHGSSAIAKSGGANIFAMRDKNNEDSIIKNTTRVTASKIRWTGRSGACGKWYYDIDSHTLFDFDTYFGKE